MRKLLVTYQVKDADWWLLNNTLEKTVGHMGFRFEFFRQPKTNLVGYIVEVSDEDAFKEVLFNSTIISDKLKEHGVLMETIQTLEAVKR